MVLALVEVHLSVIVPALGSVAELWSICLVKMMGSAPTFACNRSLPASSTVDGVACSR